MLVRGDFLSKGMSLYLVDQILKTENIKVWLNSSVVEVKGEKKLEAITILDSIRSEKQTVPAYALFIFIGAQPRTDWLEGTVKRDANGFILTGSDLLIENGHNDGNISNTSRPKGWKLDRQPFLLETNIPGIFAAGDVRSGSVKRVASGVGEGSIANVISGKPSVPVFSNISYSDGGKNNTARAFSPSIHVNKNTIHLGDKQTITLNGPNFKPVLPKIGQHVMITGRYLIERPEMPGGITELHPAYAIQILP